MTAPARSVKPQRAFEIDPGNVDAVSLLASKKLAEGDADGALKLLNSLTARSKGRNANLAAEDADLCAQEGFRARPKAFCAR